MLTAPFPYFGGKRHAAAIIWRALGGRVASYAEPFCGSAAVLLARPGGAGRIETINDASGFVANFWRAVRSAPAEVAHWADYPVVEVDLHSRHRWLRKQRARLLELLADPEAFDAKAAGWWAWGASCWIGGGWCSDDVRHGEATAGGGRIQELYKGRALVRESTQIPHLSHTGTALHGRRPALCSTGTGAHKPNVGKRPKTALGSGVMGTTPIESWMLALAERLRRVRVCCGDWRRIVTRSALASTLAGGGRHVGIFLDPPYGVDREKILYDQDSLVVAAEVATWARDAAAEHGWRIVLAGYADEHEMPGWRCVEWYRTGFGAGGYGTDKGTRERLWLSPACLSVTDEQGDLFNKEQ